MPDHFPDYPKREQVLEYLQAFARHYGLLESIQFDSQIKSVTQQTDQSWTLELANGQSTNHQILICASGPLWFPNIPSYEGQFTGEIRHANTYKKASELIGKRVLVIGGGNSAVDIACEAASFASHAAISMRRGYYFIPKHIFGKPTDVFAHEGPKLPVKLNQWVLKKLLRLAIGDQTKFGLPKPDHEARFEGQKAIFTDGTELEIDLVLFATGYNQHLPYMPQFFDWQDQRPNLFLNVFNRQHDNLFVLGFMETNSAAYELFTEQDKLLVNYIKAKVANPTAAQIFRDKVVNDNPDMTGGIQFLKTARNTGYVDSDTYRAYILKVQKQLGWQPYQKGEYA